MPGRLVWVNTEGQEKVPSNLVSAIDPPPCKLLKSGF